MRRIRNKLYWLAMMFVLLSPLQVSAAGKDEVALGQDGSEVTVSLNMGEAEEENITAVSVSLKVDAGDNGLIGVDFEFAPELSEAECGYRYIENGDNTGRLDIYAVTGQAQSLFREGKLDLGNIKVTPRDSRDMSVEVSYCEGSFQTANVAYGEKTPLVDSPEPVRVQFGEDKPEPDRPGNDNDDNNEDNNMDDGLYDDDTEFENDPSDSQLIPSDVISPDGNPDGLKDLSKGVENKASVKLKSPGSGKGNVTVVPPESGMSSILVSKADNAGENSGTAGTEQTGTEAEEAEEEGKEVEEILLDQVNGGAQKEDRKSGMFLAAGLAVIAVAVLVVFGILFYRKKKDEETDREKAKKRREARKKKAAQKKKAARKKKKVHKGRK